MLSINTTDMCHFIAHIHMILILIFIETVELLTCSFFSLIAEKLYFIFKRVETNIQFSVLVFQRCYSTLCSHVQLNFSLIPGFKV